MVPNTFCILITPSFIFRADWNPELNVAQWKVELSVKDINAWMVYNGLKLNQISSLFSASISMLGHQDYVDFFEEQIQPPSSAKDLGVIFDACLFL